MTQTNFAQMTAAEYDEELDIHALKESLQKARNAYKKAREAEEDALDAVKDMGISPDFPIGMPNVLTIEEAIVGYIHDRKDINLRVLVNNIRTWYKEAHR